MIVPIPDVHAGMGLLMAALSVPLILRRIPMNHLYGVRLRKAFSCERNWYELNAYGGKVLLAFGAFLLAFGLAGRAFAPAPTSPWAPVYLAVPLLGLVPALLLIVAFARRLPDR